ncbi:MAG: class I SAM-dependent methyltransferase, partial [Actinomycetes bacterium]
LDVAMGYSGGLYANQMQTVVEKFGSFSPKKILDVGCDEGLLTCFYAMLWPDAEVVGRDLLPEGIALATELAQSRFSFGDRVRFEKSSIATAKQPAGKFDLVFASRALLAESIPTTRRGKSFRVDSPTGINEDRAATVIGNLVATLNPDGLLFALDRMRGPNDAHALAKIIESCGGFVDWEQSELVIAKELQSADQRIPALLVSLTQPELRLPATCGALALFAEPNTEDSRELEGGTAEAIATALNKDRLLLSARLTEYSGYSLDESETGSFEVWACGPLVLEYRSWTNGARRATLHSARVARQIVEKVRGELEEQMYDLPGEFDTEPVLSQAA